jgi:hypothetical protein
MYSLFWGVSSESENIPNEPDPGNAGEGKKENDGSPAKAGFPHLWSFPRFRHSFLPFMINQWVYEMGLGKILG